MSESLFARVADDPKKAAFIVLTTMEECAFTLEQANLFLEKILEREAEYQKTFKGVVSDDRLKFAGVLIDNLTPMLEASRAFVIAARKAKADARAQVEQHGISLQ